jgi:dephospho-CoA kinase
MPIDEKRGYATHIIDNSGSFEATRRQVKAVFEKLAEPS